MIDAKEMIRFEQAFNCKGLFEEKHALGIALILTRIFVYAMTCEGYKYSVIARSINKSRPMIYAYLANTTDIEKSLYLLKMLISLFTDKNDVVIDPCAGSGSTLLACEELGRKSYGFEIKKEFVKNFNEVLMKNVEKELF